MKDPDTFMNQLQSETWNYKLKAVGPPKYHLGGDFFCDSDGTLCYGSQTYVKRMCDNYFQLFGEDLFSKVHSFVSRETIPSWIYSIPVVLTILPSSRALLEHCSGPFPFVVWILPML